MDEISIGFIGAGNMAKAIGFRLIESGLIPSEKMIVSAPSDRNLAAWREKGVQTTNVNDEVINFGGTSHFVFLAMKPQQFTAVMLPLSYWPKNASKNLCFVSLMAGVSLEKLDKEMGKKQFKALIVRVMPNTPVMIGAGCSVMCTFDENNLMVDQLRHIMSVTGTCDLIPESVFTSVSPLNGCGPAFIYLAIEALADAAVRLGAPRDLALRLAAQTVSGAGQMVIETGKHPGQLKDEVCSPGGTTIAGICELENSGFRNALIKALTAACSRGKELSKE